MGNIIGQAGRPTLLYLHGFASGPASGKAGFFRERLKGIGIPLVIPDLSEGDFENLTISGQLRVIERLAGDGPAVLIGSSMGGYLAALAAVRSSAVKKLLLLAPAFGFARRWAESMAPEKLEEWRRTGWLEVFHYGEKTRRRVGYGLMEDALRFEDYPQATQPTLIFHGRNDDVAPYRYSEEFAARQANARLEVLESDHQLLDVLDRIWEQARGFLIS